MRLSDPGDARRWLRPIGFLTAIPFVLMVGPLIGYFAGDWLDHKFGTSPWLMTAFVAFGFVAAAREVWGLIKKASKE